VSPILRRQADQHHVINLDNDLRQINMHHVVNLLQDRLHGINQDVITLVHDLLHVTFHHVINLVNDLLQVTLHDAIKDKSELLATSRAPGPSTKRLFFDVLLSTMPRNTAVFRCAAKRCFSTCFHQKSL
jgi:hypothetical protein